MQKIVILMGLPGSGKSTWARAMRDREGAEVVSADHYFDGGPTGEDPKVPFDPRDLGKAHAACFMRFLTLVRTWERTVIVDNTNTALVDLAPYVAVANAYGVSCELRHFPCTMAFSAGNNIHNVPEPVIARMGRDLAETLRAIASAPHRWPAVTEDSGDHGK